MSFTFPDSIVIVLGFKREYYGCAIRECRSASPDSRLETVTMDQAKERGWVFTDDIKYCPPGMDKVGICPKCAKALNLTEKQTKE